MAQYYIHIDNGVGFLSDEKGQDFVDFEAARLYAIRSGAEIIGDELRGQAQTVTLTLYIEDANHAPLATLPMQASMECRTRPDPRVPDPRSSDPRLEGDIAKVPLYP